MTDTSTVPSAAPADPASTMVEPTPAAELPEASAFKAPPSSPILDAQPEAPVIQHSAWGTKAGLRRVPLFTITQPHPLAGEVNPETNEPYPAEISTTYDMPAQRHPGMLLEYLTVAREQGAIYAMGWVIEAVAGREAYIALVREPDISDGVIGGVVNRIQDVLGGKAKDVDYSLMVNTPFPT